MMVLPEYWLESPSDEGPSHQFSVVAVLGPAILAFEFKSMVLAEDPLLVV